MKHLNGMVLILAMTYSLAAGAAQNDRLACQNELRQCTSDCARAYSSGSDKDRCQASCQSAMVRCTSRRSSLPAESETYALFRLEKLQVVRLPRSNGDVGASSSSLGPTGERQT